MKAGLEVRIVYFDISFFSIAKFYETLMLALGC